MRVTLGTQRAIKIAGGFDRYIYYTPEEKYVGGRRTGEGGLGEGGKEEGGWWKEVEHL